MRKWIKRNHEYIAVALGLAAIVVCISFAFALGFAKGMLP